MVKRFVSIAVSCLFTASSILMSGFSFFTKPAFFIETVAASDDVDKGTYTVSIKYTSEDSFDNINQSNGNGSLAAHLNTRAILDVEDSATFITIGVENWSLHDAFIPVSQYSLGENEIPTNTYPSLLLEKNSDFLNANLSKTKGEITFDENLNNYFLWNEEQNSDVENKYGKISVTSYDEEKDVAYVKFEIDSANEPIKILRWFNRQTNGDTSTRAKTSRMSAYGYTNIIIELDSITSIQEIKCSLTNNQNLYAKMLQANKLTSFSSASVRGVGFTIDNSMQEMLDSAEVVEFSNDRLVVNYYFADGLENLPNKLLTPESKTHLSGKSQEWDLTPDNDKFTEISLQVSEGRTFFQLTYKNLNEYLFGKYIFAYCTESETEQYMRFVPTADISSYNEVIAPNQEDDVLSFVVKTNTSKYPEGTKLIVTEGYDDIKKNYFYSSVYNQDSIRIYSFELTDAEGNVLKNKGSVSLTINLPDDFAFDKYYGAVMDLNCNYISLERYSAESIEKRFDSVAKTWTEPSINVDTHYFVFAEYNERADIGELKPEASKTEIYSCIINFVKNLSYGTNSMSNGGLIHEAYLVIDVDANENITRKLYFNNQSLDVNGQSGLYIGDVFCNNPNQKGEVYRNDTKYLKFLTDENEELVDNCGYDPITEWACPQRAVITLNDKSYREKDLCYNMAVASPAMASIGNSAYEEIEDDELIVDLVFQKFELQENMTEDDVKALFPYDKSALRRTIQQKEVSANLGKHSSVEIKELKEAWDVYNNADSYTPEKLEAVADSVKDIEIASVPTAKVTTYEISSKDDFTLNYYLELGYDAENDDNAAVQFKVGNRTVTKVIDKDSYEDGKGYLVSLDVAAKEMADNITATVVLSNGTPVGDATFSKYSVKNYFDEVVHYYENPAEAAEYGVTVTEAQYNAAKAALSYGAYAQKFFGYGTADEGDLSKVSEITAETIGAKTDKIDLGMNTISLAGTSLSLESKVALNLYFEQDGMYALDKYAFTVKSGGTEKQVKLSENGDYYALKIDDIYAREIGNSYEITVTNTKTNETATFEYSPYNYICTALTKTDADEYANLHNLVKALYAYSEAAAKCS